MKKKSTKPPKASAKARKQTIEHKASPALTELLGKALTDKEFRANLAAERETVIRKFDLTKADIAFLKKISAEQLEAQAQRLGGRAAWTIKIVISKSF